MTVNGNTFFVPQSESYAYTSDNNSDDRVDNSFQISSNAVPEEEWTQQSTTTPKHFISSGFPDSLRDHLQDLDLKSSLQMDPADNRYKEIPSRFHSAYPLDSPNASRGTGGTFGYPSSIYKVVDRLTNQIYALRRFDNVRTANVNILKSSQSKWSLFRHSSIIQLHLIAQEKGAVFFVHSYFPSSHTIQERFLTRGVQATPENIIWRLICQLIVCIRSAHAQSLAIRCIGPTHVLYTSGGRFRIANCGVMDVLEFESRKSLADMQAEDLVRLGYLVLSMATQQVVTPKVVDQALLYLQQKYSNDLYRTATILLSGSRTADQVCLVLYPKICSELENSWETCDSLHGYIRAEYENSRMFRLLVKLGLVNERPEYAMAPSWSETDDRYVLKLFRDYLFHQVDSKGVPQIDVGHVVSSLNKLDCGDTEKILLSSRDGKDMLVVSFQDIRRYSTSICMCNYIPIIAIM